jgi:hypothetical protein
MATIRHHTRIDRPADEVWALLEDFGGLDAWFPGIDGCTLEGDVRTVATMGIEIEEQLVTSDGELRRQQYSIVGGPMVPEYHLATIDVIEDGAGSIVIYSCEVKPDETGELFRPIYGQATQAIKAAAES